MAKLTREEKRAAKLAQKQKEHDEYVANVINYNRVASKEIANRSREKKNHPGAYVSIQEVNKIYDNLVQAVYDFNLDIKKNEFIVFVGPSGCGKSTTLRMIAGLEEITAGNLFIDGKYANALPPKDRDIAMVFQSYALYPHMTVYDNMAFALRIKPYDLPMFDENGNAVTGIDERHIADLQKQLQEIDREIANFNKYGFTGASKELVLKPLEEHRASILKQIEEAKVQKVHLKQNRKFTKDEIDEAVHESAKILQIEDYLDRKPKALSGGQRQRVALGRAIVKKAKLFLMDEPLSNLDAKLRVSMRSEIKRIHQTIGATTIYVTHDQTEAMTMADRIVIMEKGVIQQIGSPKEIYNHPNNIFVATFIGSPAMNILPCKVKDGKIDFSENGVLEIPSEFVDALKKNIEEKIAKIAHFKENGLQEEFEKEKNVAIEAISTEIKQGKYKKKDGGDPLDNLALSEEEKQICQDLYDRALTPMLEKEAKYKKMLETGEFDVFFGARPEDVYLIHGNIGKEVKPSNGLKSKVVISELLGNEYFVHVKFADSDFILKTGATSEVKDNEEIEMVFDLNKIHLFDDIDKSIII